MRPENLSAMDRVSCGWLALLLAFAAGSGASVAAAAARSPNVLFIVVDDLNTSLGCYGNPAVKSPAIDRLAARGVRFDRAYCQYPLCNPSRVSFLSGIRPESTGVYVLTTAARTALPNAVLLPQFFRERGYFSGGAGKVFHNNRVNDATSWDFYEDGEGADPQEKAAISSRYGGGDGRPAWHELDGDGSQTRDGLNTSTIVRLMQERTAAGAPFFLAAGFHKPHLPWTAPRRFFDLYPGGSVVAPAEPAMSLVPAVALQTELSGFEQPASRADAMRGYYACISFTDHQIGLLLDELDRLRLWESTVVVLLSDNGFHLGDHGGMWSKLSAFDAATRVPLIFAGAGVPAGRVVRDSVELIDIYPTLADLCGFDVPSGLHGKSLVSLMRGAAAGPAHAFSIVGHYNVAADRDVVGRTVIGPDWRYTTWATEPATSEFYRHTDDRGEYVNQIGEAAAQAQIRQAESLLRAAPAPKPGPMNRPRAMVPVARK